MPTTSELNAQIQKEKFKFTEGDLYISTHDPIVVVLCTGSDPKDRTFKGTVIYSLSDLNYKIGTHSLQWAQSHFKPLIGSVTLTYSL